MVSAAATAQGGAMTSTPPPPLPPDQPEAPPSDPGPRVDRDQVRDLGRLRRTVDDRKVAGVAGGLGRHLDIDPLVLRVAFVALVFFGGAGLIVYGACWLLVPEDGRERAVISLDERSRSVALLVAGAIGALALVGDSWGAFWFPWPLAIVALVALWLLTRNNNATPKPSWPASMTPPPPAVPGTYDAPVTTPYPAYDPAAYSPGPTYPAYTPPPRNPRRRGPILFWFTLALIALCEGLLGIVDLAGVDVPDSAYAALAVGITGLMLLVGSFFGRAGGLILVGLISTMFLVGATVSDNWDGDNRTETPTSAAAVDSRYQIGAGELVLDLRDVVDVDRLDGRTIELEGGVGRLQVILPRDLAANIDADVDGPGNITVFSQEHGGIDISKSLVVGSPQDPEISIDAQLGVGQIEVSYR